jgi:hypothetical protein
MVADYPAAHSMDTVWFAVDAIGQVAYFDSGEEGPVPRDGRGPDISDELCELRRPAGAPDDDYNPLDYLYEVVGLYAFGHGGCGSPTTPYGCQVAPAVPLHVDQLPPELRWYCKAVAFPVRFAAELQLQPLEHGPCGCWVSRAYVCSDGKTVRPVPGEEAHFAEFVRELHQLAPEVAKDLIFDGPTEEGQP